MTQRKPAPPPSFAPGHAFDPKPGLISKNDLKDPKKGGRQLRRDLASPCDRPPATPTGVRMVFHAVEAKTHLDFKCHITWDNVTADTSGFPITTVDRWDVQWQAVDDGGDPVEVEHSALTRAWTVGDTFWFETGRDISPSTSDGLSWHVGDRVKITGCFPQTNYNGTATITDIPAAHQFTVDGNAGESDARRVGEVYNLSTDQHYRRKMRNPQPKIALRRAQMVIRTSDHHNVSSITNPAGTTYRVNTGASNTWDVGDYVKLEGFSSNAYNGVWRVKARVDSDTFDVEGDTGGLGSGGPGDAYTATTVYRYTTRGESGFNLGQRVRIAGCRPQLAYNGTWTITAIDVAAQTFDVEPTHDPDDGLQDAEVLGSAYNETDNLHIVVPHVPRPKTWRWQARVRCRSGEGCWSAFSDWTDPVLPWEGADPLPPSPDYGDFPITFDHKGKGKQSKIRLLFTFDEVTDWDVPGGDREEDVAAYIVQLASSLDGLTWEDPPYRTKHRRAKDDDADETVTTVFGNIHRHLWYRCRVRTVDRFHRKGDWSEWTDAALPFDDVAPPAPVEVEVFPQSTDRVVVAWEDPTIDVPCAGSVSGSFGSPTLTGSGTRFDLQVEAGSIVKVNDVTYTVKTVTSATAMTLTSSLSTSPSAARLYEVVEDSDVAIYAVQIARFADVDLGATPNEWSAVYAHDRSEGRRKGFKIRTSDTDVTFFARVRSVDAAHNRSVWIPAWVRSDHGGNANSDPDADGDGVVIIPGTAGATATWNHAGKIDTDYQDLPIIAGDLTAPYEMPPRFDNLTGGRLYFKSATAGCGDREAGTGEPQGAAIIVQLRRWETDGTTVANLFTLGNRLNIADGTWHAQSDTFAIDYLEPGEAVSAQVSQYGSSNSGRNLVVQLFMSTSAPVSS